MSSQKLEELGTSRLFLKKEVKRSWAFNNDTVFINDYVYDVIVGMHYDQVLGPFKHYFI